MSVEVFASGTTLADGTEQFLSSPGVAGEYDFVLDRSNMAAGDVVQVRAYQIVASGGSPVLRHFWILSGAVGTNQPMAFAFDRLNNGHVATNALRFSIQQTAGTYRNFPWSVTRITEQADVAKWNGTAVEMPTTGGRPEIEVASIDSTVQAALIDAIWDELLSGHNSILNSAGKLINEIKANILDIINSGVVAVSVSDKTNYSLSSAARAAIVDEVLDELLGGHAILGSVGAALTAAAGASGITVADIYTADPADYDADADSFAARFLQMLVQTLLIGSAEIEVVAPVATTGRVTIYQGKDYALADGTQLSWTSASQINLTGATVTLDVDGEQFAAAVSGAAGAWTITVDLTAAETAALAVGVYPYEVVAELSPSGRTPPPLVTGTLEVRGER